MTLKVCGGVCVPSMYDNPFPKVDRKVTKRLKDENLNVLIFTHNHITILYLIAV